MEDKVLYLVLVVNKVEFVNLLYIKILVIEKVN